MSTQTHTIPPTILSPSTSASASSPNSTTSPPTIPTQLNYYKNLTGESFAPTVYSDKPETFQVSREAVDVVVHDMRGREAEFSLDTQGFQLFRFPSAEKTFDDEERVKAGYYAETERLLKEATGASKVHIFDHTIRRDAPSTDPSSGTRSPAMVVHIDQSYQASLNRVSYHLPSEAPLLLKGRVQIINVWRPIKTIQRDPLAVADARSVEEEDLVPQALVYPHRKGETLTVLKNAAHRWWFASVQGPEEVLLIKCFDSKEDGRARRVPHSAFVVPGTQGLPARESIEIRALVFHEDDRD